MELFLGYKPTFYLVFFNQIEQRVEIRYWEEFCLEQKRGYLVIQMKDGEIIYDEAPVYKSKKLAN